MNRTAIIKITLGMIGLCLVFGFGVSPTFAGNSCTHCKWDSFFGHTVNSAWNDPHDSEWPTEEQPVTPLEICKGCRTISHHGTDGPDSEWPTEEQPELGK